MITQRRLRETKPYIDPIYKTTKKSVFLRLVFKGDKILNEVRHKISSTINRTFPAADLHIFQNTQKTILIQREYSRMSISASHLVH